MKVLVFYKNDDRYIKEYLRAALKRLRYAAFFVALAGFLLCLLFYRMQNILISGVLLGASLLSLLVGILLVPMTFREFKAREKKITGGEKEVMLRFFDDRAQIHQGEAHLEILYRYLERVYTTGDLYIFQLDRGSGFYLPKSAIDDANKDAFRELLSGPLAPYLK
ncbi:MAG: YcxB family protein [Peptoniphilus sp.]|nr:YcxB family protein [Peptoniphilus sp.]MDD7363302.1 YcxB family protein [Bacillota bacterium]MDY6045397.1 YcxB family protein [Peptoniphilus sp.]